MTYLLTIEENLGERFLTILSSFYFLQFGEHKEILFTLKSQASIPFAKTVLCLLIFLILKTEPNIMISELRWAFS
jgi:hypothetical protein